MLDCRHNMQDVLLTHLSTTKVPTTIFLVNGVKLQGMIAASDENSVLLRRDGHVQLVYKHAISTIMPNVAIKLFEGTEERDDEKTA